MLLEYIQAGLRDAKYEILPDDGACTTEKSLNLMVYTRNCKHARRVPGAASRGF